MAKKEMHEMFKDYIVTCRKDKAIIHLGYLNAPEGYAEYSEERERQIIDICERNGLQYERKAMNDLGYRAVRIYIAM